MKILMVLESDFPPDIRVENEALSLVEAGHEVHVACYTQKGASGNQIWNDIKIHRKKISTFLYKSSVGALKFPFYFNFWRKHITELIEELGIDCVHIHDLPLARVGFEMKQKYGIKFVLDLHENWPALLSISEHTKGFLGKILSSDQQWKKYESKYVKLADRVIVVVDEAKERIVKLGANEKDVAVVSNTLNVDEFDFEHTQQINEALTLIYGGGINFHRGLQFVLDAIAKLKDDSKIKLWIVGDGRYLETLKSQSDRLGLGEKVHFFGWISRQELISKILQADVALIPHIKTDHTDNTIPHKLFQYMYAEVPIISSDCNPLKRIIEETDSGYVFQSGNVNELAELFDNLMNDPKELNLRKNGKSFVEKKYNWLTDKECLNNMYENL